MHDTYLLFYLLKARVTSTATYAIAPLTYVLSCLPCTVLLEPIAVTCKVLLDEIFFCDCGRHRLLRCRKMSVTRRYCVKTAKHIVKLFTTGSHVILVFLYKT